MSAAPGDIVRVRLGVDSNSGTQTSMDGSTFVGTYEGPVITGNSIHAPVTLTPSTGAGIGATIDIKDIDYSFKTSPNYVEETVFGTTPVYPGFTWNTIPEPIAIEFKQFVKDSKDGAGILSFTEWACKNCDGVLLRKVKDMYREKYGKNILFDADSMFWIMDRCKKLEERVERIEDR